MHHQAFLANWHCTSGTQGIERCHGEGRRRLHGILRRCVRHSLGPRVTGLGSRMPAGSARPSARKASTSWVFCRPLLERNAAVLASRSCRPLSPRGLPCRLLAPGTRSGRIVLLSDRGTGPPSTFRGKLGRHWHTTTGFTTSALDGSGLRRHQSTRPTPYASYQVLAHRLAPFLHASFRPRLATTPLHFAGFLEPIRD